VLDRWKWEPSRVKRGGKVTFFEGVSGEEKERDRQSQSSYPPGEKTEVGRSAPARAKGVFYLTTDRKRTAVHLARKRIFLRAQSGRGRNWHRSQRQIRYGGKEMEAASKASRGARWNRPSERGKERLPRRRAREEKSISNRARTQGPPEDKPQLAQKEKKKKPQSPY